MNRTMNVFDPVMFDFMKCSFAFQSFDHPAELDLNDDERKKLARMSEKEREQMIYNRMEEMEIKKAR